MGRRVLQIVLLFVAVTPALALFAVAPTLIYNRVAYGTLAAWEAPTRVDYCGRRYYPAEERQPQTLAEVTSFLAENKMSGFTQVATAPWGRPVVANVMSPEIKAKYMTQVCSMEVWVKTGNDAYVPYALSGGP
jgi:hypothetical protein